MKLTPPQTETETMVVCIEAGWTARWNVAVEILADASDTDRINALLKLQEEVYNRWGRVEAGCFDQTFSDARFVSGGPKKPQDKVDFIVARSKNGRLRIKASPPADDEFDEEEE